MTIKKLIKSMIFFYITLIVIVSVSIYNLLVDSNKINGIYQQSLDIVIKSENLKNSSIDLVKFSDAKAEITKLKDDIDQDVIFIYAIMLIASISFIFSYIILKRKILTPISDMNNIITLSQKGLEDIEEIPVNNDEIGVMIKEFFIMKKMLKDDYIALEEIASKDPLTAILNRRSFFEISDKLFKLALRNKSYLSILIIDIDFFKKVNDTYGHLVGDDIINYIVENVQKEIRETDVFARFGGEEFIILLPNTDEDGAFLLAEKVRIYIENNPYIDDRLSIPITVSIGLSELKDEKLLRELIKRADQALYKAKENERNMVQIG